MLAGEVWVCLGSDNMALPMDSELRELFVFVKLDIVKLVVLCSWFIESH